MRRNSFGVLFFLKKNQLLKSGEAPVSMRITVNGQREEIRTKKSINPSLWKGKIDMAKKNGNIVEEPLLSVIKVASIFFYSYLFLATKIPIKKHLTNRLTGAFQGVLVNPSN
ncbi:Arm DNA-binding domain-containing protein [Parabacteroides sp. PF5-6]|uniref:Arm DNA-binding domain-containing protein n=1 Tax=Parabacteroides sp. PF5-6 TaxID=1742403 RepID=UPI0024050C88|nr:Arm DNA-binding domain-containing protein [Parabacteroides sp. PF5-6]MDF9830667.1 hypothetical protein [Parabacteroides sp. PF5-6]